MVVVNKKASENEKASEKIYPVERPEISRRMLLPLEIPVVGRPTDVLRVDRAAVSTIFSLASMPVPFACNAVPQCYFNANTISAMRVQLLDALVCAAAVFAFKEG